MGLAEMLAMAARDHDGEDTPRILPEATIMRMRELAVRYAEMIKGPRFKIGDIVTPRADANTRGSGNPHLVLETRRAEPDFGVGSEGSCAFGCRHDMRVFSIPDNENVVAHWVESYTFEIWTGADGGGGND